jgi:hypothetical protein
MSGCCQRLKRVLAVVTSDSFSHETAKTNFTTALGTPTRVYLCKEKQASRKNDHEQVQRKGKMK